MAHTRKSFPGWNTSRDLQLYSAVAQQLVQVWTIRDWHNNQLPWLIKLLYHLPGPILHRLRQVRRLYPLAPRQVGYRPCQLQYPVVCSRREVQLAHGRFDERLPRRVQLAEVAYLCGAHLGVGGHSLDILETLSLYLAGGLYAGADGRGGLAQAVVGQLLVLHAGHFYVDVYPIKEGAADLLLVAGDHGIGAGAFLLRVPVPSAW